MRESKQALRARAARVTETLKRVYPDAACALAYGGEDWKLLVLGRLSAQCTDKRVNLVGQALFAAFPTLDALADADVHDVENLVRPCGLYRVKAQNVVDACRAVRDEFGGRVPSDMEALLTLPGVGRKIANLLRGDLYGLPAVVADTHCIRICTRLGFCKPSEADPVHVERNMTDLLDPAESSDFCHRIVQFGRDTCSARSPKCGECPLASECPSAKSV